MRTKRYNKRTEAGTDENAVEKPKVKEAKPVFPDLKLKPMRLLRRVMNNPNLGYQIMVIILTLTAEDTKMDRRINGMTSSIDTLRGITDVITNSMNSLRQAAEAPRQIRRLIDPGDR